MNKVVFPEHAKMIAARTRVSVTISPVTEDEGECETCEFEGLMEFVEEGTETAVAECPQCGDRVEKYIGPDVD
jgi:hypothetical protein